MLGGKACEVRETGRAKQIKKKTADERSPGTSNRCAISCGRPATLTVLPARRTFAMPVIPFPFSAEVRVARPTRRIVLALVTLLGALAACSAPTAPHGDCGVYSGADSRHC